MVPQQSFSERIYACIVRLYPKTHRKEFGDEMKFVFAESFKDARAHNGWRGAIRVWQRTITDSVTTIPRQYIEATKGEKHMKSTHNTPSTAIIMKNSIFGWVLLATLLLISIPFIASRFLSDINWSPFDYIVMGIALFSTASLFVVLARKFPNRKLLIGILTLVGFLYVWAELAVGIFTNLGS